MRKFLGKFGLMVAVLMTPGLIGQAQENDTLGSFEDLELVSGEQHAAAAVMGDDGFIGIIACTYQTDYHFTVVESAVEYAEDLNLNVQSFDSELDVEKQISAIETFTAQGAQVIIICLFDPPSVESALEEAADAGVLMVQYSGRQLAELGGVTISADDAKMGYMAGAYAAQLINDEMGGTAHIAILDYPDLPNIILRAEAIRKALEDLAPDAEIVGNYLGGTTETGLASMEVALIEHSEINVVVSINDAGAYGALQAFENAGVADAIVIGIDAEAHARDLIESGKIFRGTVDTVPAVTGIMTINAAVKLLAGSEIPQNIEVPIQLVTAE